jgi:hypothetical protein
MCCVSYYNFSYLKLLQDNLYTPRLMYGALDLLVVAYSVVYLQGNRHDMS